MNSPDKYKNLPLDLVSDLKVGKRIQTDSQGWFELVSIDDATFTSVQTGPFTSKQNGQFYTNVIGLIGNTEHYGFYPGALVWLPRLNMYGTWDASHEELHVFPDQTWTEMKSNLVPYIEAQWGSYKGKERIKQSTIKRITKYPNAFDFLSYDIVKEANQISIDQCPAFLEKHEDAILRHPGCESLSDTYVALAKVYFVLGTHHSDKEEEWKEKCFKVINYFPENRFHHEKQTAEICSWLSASFGLLIFQKLLDKNKKNPEYAGGADLLGALFHDHGNIDSQIAELAGNPKYTSHILRCLETAKHWALTLANDPIFSKLKKNSKALNSISDLILQMNQIILSSTEGVYPPEEIHLVRAKNVIDRVVKGWSHINKQEYSQAEELVRSALSEYPEDGQALFLDARLSWLSSDSVEIGVQRAKENLLKATKFDLPALAQIHNLIGCGLDILSRSEEAIYYFEKAADLEPKEAIYASNLAEIHWKLDKKALAAKYARKASRLGSKSSIVETILKETEKPSEKRWKNLLKEWKDSGLDEDDFCVSKDLSINAFQHWKRKWQ